MLCKGIVSYQVKKSEVPQNIELLPSLLTSITMLENVNVFNEFEVCGGVNVSHVNSKNVLQVQLRLAFDRNLGARNKAKGGKTETPLQNKKYE